MGRAWGCSQSWFLAGPPELQTAHSRPGERRPPHPKAEATRGGPGEAPGTYGDIEPVGTEYVEEVSELHAGPRARDSPAPSHVHLLQGVLRGPGAGKPGRAPGPCHPAGQAVAPQLASTPWPFLQESTNSLHQGQPLPATAQTSRADGFFTSFCPVQSRFHSQLAPWHLPAQMSPVWVCAGCFVSAAGASCGGLPLRQGIRQKSWRPKKVMGCGLCPGVELGEEGTRPGAEPGLLPAPPGGPVSWVSWCPESSRALGLASGRLSRVLS